MKLSTRKILGIDVCVLVAMLVLVWLPIAGVLRNYLEIAVMVGALGVAYITLGWAQPKQRESKLVTILIILAAVVFQLVMFVLLGMKLGFVKNIYALNFNSFWMIFLPTVMLIIGKEILRGQLVEKGRNSLAAIIATGAMLWIVEVLVELPLYDFAEARSWFDILSVVALPGLLNNILLTYVAYFFNYRINIAYCLVMELPALLLPIWPDVNEYLIVLFQTLMMFVLLAGLISIQKFGGMVCLKLEAVKKPKRLKSESALKRQKTVRNAVIAVVTIVMLAYAGLMSGMFKYYFLAVGSGSMEPNLSRGDMVLVEKSDKYSEMEVGEILVYRRSNVVIVHRIAEKREDNGAWTFITKGDANGSNDNWAVGQGDVIGLARGKIVMFGYPTLWLNELFNGGKI